MAALSLLWGLAAVRGCGFVAAIVSVPGFLFSGLKTIPPPYVVVSALFLDSFHALNEVMEGTLPWFPHLSLVVSPSHARDGR